jgi:hypothetical protein
MPAGTRGRVEVAGVVPQKRGFYVFRMQSRDIRAVCALDDAGECSLELADRAHDRILKIARTVAGLAEAAQYRSRDLKCWNWGVQSAPDLASQAGRLDDEAYPMASLHMVCYASSLRF